MTDFCITTVNHRANAISAFRLLMICSVILFLGQLESFRNYKGFDIVFPKILEEIESFTKVRIFLIRFSIAFANPKTLGFLQFYEKIASAEDRVKSKKLNFRKSKGIY